MIGEYSLDIAVTDRPFINIEVSGSTEKRVLIGAYEDGKIARKLFYIDKHKLELLIKGLTAVNSLID